MLAPALSFLGPVVLRPIRHAPVVLQQQQNVVDSADSGFEDGCVVSDGSISCYDSPDADNQSLRSELARAQMLCEAQKLVIQRYEEVAACAANDATAEKELIAELTTGLESEIRRVEYQDAEIDELSAELKEAEEDLETALGQLEAARQQIGDLQAAMREMRGDEAGLEGRVVPTVSLSVSSRPHPLS